MSVSTYLPIGGVWKSSFARGVACAICLAIVLTSPHVEALALVGVKSIKPHGSAGPFEIAVDITQLIGGAVTVESRAISAGHQLVFQFDSPIAAAGTVTAANVNGAMVGTATSAASGNDVVVTLGGIPENQRLAITLRDINGSLTLPPVSIGFLVGDVNGTASVNSSDISGVKARSGQNTDASNFRFDVNGSGAINSSDISAIKARSGLVLAATNVAPVARAGTSQSVVAGNVVTLDGTASSDGNGDPLTYSWSLVSKPLSSTSFLSSITATKPTFTADVAGMYVASLVVNDGQIDSGTASVSISAEALTAAPSPPSGLAFPDTSSNSVTLTWTASTNGAGGVYSYQVNRNGQQIGNTNAGTTTFLDTNLDPSTTYVYTVTATAVGGAKSANSPIAATSTLDFSLMKAKLKPYIVIELATGRIARQAFASPGIFAATALLTGYDYIEHAAIDTNLYGVRSVGVRQYSLYLYATGEPVGATLPGILVGGSANGSVSWTRIDMNAGRVSGGGSVQTQTLLLNVGPDGYGGYIPGERL